MRLDDMAIMSNCVKMH